jgi:protein TonB
MERPNHLQVANQNNSSKVTGLVIVIALHVVAVFGLVVALNQAAISKKIQDIKATVEVPKEIPKAPPPPPPDLVKPPPPVAIVPDFKINTAPPPAPVRTAPPAPTAPARVAASDPLRPVGRTHTLPPYPPISVRLGEQGTTLMLVHITTEGNVDDCKVEKGSGSDRLDAAACEFVKARWRWSPPTNQGAPTAVSTRVSVKWDLKDAK